MLLRKTTLSTLLCLASTSCILSLHADTLHEALHKTLDCHPQVKSATYNIKASEYSTRAAEGPFYPQVNVSSSVFYNKEQNFFRNRPSTSLSSTNIDGNLIVSQLVFDGFETLNRLRFEKNRLGSAAFGLDETQENLAIGLVQSYIDVLRFRNLIILSQENVDTHRDILEKNKERYEHGAGTKADVDLVRARLSLAESSHTRRIQQLERAEEQYKFFTGEYPGDLILPVLDRASADFDSEGQIDCNPAVSVAKYNVKAAESLEKATKGPLYPRLDLRFRANDEERIVHSEVSNRGWRAEAIVSYDIFRGGTDYATYKENIARKREAQKDLDNVYISLIRDQGAFKDQLIRTEERVAYLDDYVLYISQVLDAYKEQFRLAKRSLLNVLDVENELFNARSSLETESKDLLLTKYQLLFVKGQVVETVLALDDAK